MKEYEIIFNNGRGSTLMNYIRANSKKEAIARFKTEFQGWLKGYKMIRCEEVIK